QDVRETRGCDSIADISAFRFRRPPFREPHRHPRRRPVLDITKSQQINPAVIYGDTDRDYVFYYLPNNVSLRTDPTTGKPVFEFLKYRFDPAEIADGGRKGGGYVQFDCSLSLTKPQQDAIKDQLQEQVDKRHQGEDPNQRPKVE